MKKYITAYLLAALLLICSFAVQAQTDTLVRVNFATGCAAPPAGWRIENVDGSCTWRCESGGITQNNHTSAGCANAANDWLIMPVLLLNKYKNEVLTFTSNTQYTGPTPTVRYSVNYPGSGNPGLYTWTQLTATFPGASGNVSLSSITGDSVYVAFQYTSSGNQNNQAARWTITDVMIRGEKSITITNQSHRNVTSGSAILGAEITDDGGLQIIERGVIWSTTANPLLATANKVQRTGTLGLFDTIVTGLPVGTQIYYRGYVRTATEDFYSAVSSFYTLANEPAQHVTLFDATANSTNSIVLNWTPSATATGYLILHKTNTTPLAIPEDANAYTAGQTIGDAVVARVITSGAAATDTIKNLLSGTRYYFTLFPFGINGASASATLNYLTTPVIPEDNDSTWGVPASYKSDITGITGSEATAVSSVENATAINLSTEGRAVWQLAFRDGGLAMNDEDALPTIFNQFAITPAPGNTANWLTMIQAVALFDDSTGNKIGTATVSATGITVTGLNMTASDNNLRTATLRMSLNKAVALPENTMFRFMIMDTSVRTASAVFSSQESSYTTISDAAKNRISVSATKIRIITQPPATADAGVVVASIVAELTDTWNNADTDTALQINVTSVRNNINNAPLSMIPLQGRATFNNIIFTAAYNADTLVFSAGNLAALKSTRVKVKNGTNADIIATPGFVYTSDLPYSAYQDSLNITTANSLPVFGLTLRDAGAAVKDPDTAQTIVTSLRFSLTNFTQVKTVALFDSTQTRLAEVYVTSGTIDFNNLDITASDDRVHHLQVRATFKRSVTDRTRIQFKVINAVSKADTISSQLIAADAGGAVSSSVTSENRIAVVATKVNIVQQPVAASVNEFIYPAVAIRAIDSLGNQDYDSRIFTVSAVRGTLNPSSVTQVALSPGTGLAVFSNLTFSDSISGTQLQFSDGSINLLSDSFNVNYPVWYRSAKTGYWDSLNTWEYSLDTGLTWQANPAAYPDAAKHGKIVISATHTVTMRATTVIDEAVIEAGATLVTPVAAGKALNVTNGKGTDLTIYGTLKHTNGSPVKGIVTQAGAVVEVMPGGMVELAAPGYAKDWAANASIIYKDNAVYYHNTSQTNAIEPATYFAHTPANEMPVFRFGSHYTYDAAGALTINGITEIVANKTVRFSAGVTLRNGLVANGEAIFDNQAHATVSASAMLSGKLFINDEASLLLDTTSSVTLTGNITLNTNNNRWLEIEGTLNGQLFTVSGNANVQVNKQACISTAHAQGVKGLFAVSGNVSAGEETTFAFNGTAQRQQSNFPVNTRIAKLIVVNPYGAALDNTVTVNKQVDLAGGPLYTLPAGMLAVNSGAAFVNYNADRFVSGKVRVSFRGTTFLPMGKAQVYSPVTIECADNTPVAYEAEYFDTLTTPAPLSGSLKRLSGRDSWILKQVSGTAKAKFTLQHRAALSGVETTADVRIAAFNNAAFESAGPMMRNATATQLTSSYISPDGLYAIAIDSTCIIPAAPAAADDTVCYGASATLTASAGPATLNWYSSATSEQALFSGNNFVTAPLVSGTDFWVEARQLSCASSRVQVKVNVAPALVKPSVADVQAVCQNTPATLSATGSGVTWFTDAALQNRVHEGGSFVTGNISSDTLFYAATTMLGCYSTPQQVAVFTRPNPLKPLTAGIAVCKGNNATLAASSNAAGIRWFAAAADTHAVATGSFIVINAPQADTTLYAAASDAGCVSERVAVHVTVNPVPEAPQLATQGYACKGSPAILQAAATGTIRWFLSDTDTLPAHTGTTYTTAPLFVNTLFFVDAVQGTCSSARLTFPVSVVNTPSGFVIRTARTVKQYDSVRVSTEGNTANEYTWNFGNDATPAVVTGAGPHDVKWSTPGVKHIRMTATNRLAMFTCAMEYDTVITVAPSTGINEQGAAVVSSTVYPNPASDVLNIEAVLKQSGTVQLRLTDAIGKTVWSETSETTGTAYRYQIDTREMNNGLYLLYLEVNGKRTTHKVIINK